MKSKKLSRIELEVVVNEILSKSKNINENKILEKYSKEIEIFESEMGLMKEKYNKLKEEFERKKEELINLVGEDNKEIKFNINSVNDLREYKDSNYYNRREKSYYIVSNSFGEMSKRGEIYNKLVLMGINDEVNIEELISKYVNEIVNS